MGKTISELTQVTTPALTDKMVVDQATATKYQTIEQLLNFIEDNSKKLSRLITIDDTIPFKYCYYRNKEKDNNLPTASQTPITVAAVVSGGNITLANYPYDPSIVNPESGKEWQIRPADGDFTNGYKITSGNLATGVFQVSPSDSSPSLALNEEVILINPFKTVRYLSTTHIITPTGGTFYSNESAAGCGIFQKSDGTYVWLMQGNNGSQIQLGYFTADSIDGPWTIGNSGNPILTASDINASYSSLGVQSNLLYIPEEERYAAVVRVLNASDSHRFHLILWKFDENFDNQEFIDDFYEEASGDGNSYGAIIRYNNKYYLFTTYRANADYKTAAWVFKYVTADALDGNWSAATTIDTGSTTATDAADEATRDGLFYSSHIDMAAPFIYNNTLYLLVGGSPRWAASGFAYTDMISVSSSNRQFGLFYLDKKDDTFKPDPRGVVVMNPQDANSNLWADYADLDDHLGANGGIFVDNDGKIYFPVTVKSTSLDYGAIIVELLIT